MSQQDFEPRRPWRFGPYRLWLYRMPWSLNYRRPRRYRLKDGWHFSALSIVVIFGYGD